MTIMTQSLDEAGSKIFIKPNANSIAGWRPKQVSYSFLSIFLLDTNSFVLYCRTMWHAAPSRRSILLLVHLLIDAAAVSNFELLRPRSKSSWKHRVSILPRVMYKTRFQSFCPFSRPPRFSKWIRLILRSVLLHFGAVSSCFQVPPPKFQKDFSAYACGGAQSRWRASGVAPTGLCRSSIQGRRSFRMLLDANAIVAHAARN